MCITDDAFTVPRVASTPRISYSIKLFWMHGDIIIMNFKMLPVFDQDSWTRQILLTNGNYFHIVNIVIMSLFMPQEILYSFNVIG